MIRIVFKNLESSELARDAVLERLAPVIEKFEGLDEQHVRVTLEMENSPVQAGPDLFKVGLQVTGGRYKGVRIVKSSSNLYVALAALADNLLERLNRFGDRDRVRRRRQERLLLSDRS